MNQQRNDPHLEDRIVFGLGQSPDGPVCFAGLSKRSFKKMLQGKTHNLDLRQIGIPLRMVIFGDHTRQDLLTTVERMNQAQGQPKPVLHVRDRVFGEDDDRPDITLELIDKQRAEAIAAYKENPTDQKKALLDEFLAALEMAEHGLKCHDAGITKETLPDVAPSLTSPPASG